MIPLLRKTNTGSARRRVIRMRLIEMRRRSGIATGSIDNPPPWARLRLGGLGSGSAVGVHQVFEFFAGLEVRDAFGRHIHARAGLGITAHARLPLARAEAAEPADFDFVAT